MKFLWGWDTILPSSIRFFPYTFFDPKIIDLLLLSEDIIKGQNYRRVLINLFCFEITKSHFIKLGPELNLRFNTISLRFQAQINATYAPLVFTKRPHTFNLDVEFGNASRTNENPHNTSKVHFSGRAGVSWLNGLMKMLKISLTSISYVSSLRIMRVISYSQTIHSPIPTFALKKYSNSVLYLHRNIVSVVTLKTLHRSPTTIWIWNSIMWVVWKCFICLNIENFYYVI